jgi:hypothetical protein
MNAYQQQVCAYADAAPRLGYTTSNPPVLTHDVVALVLQQHPDIAQDIRFTEQDAALLAQHLKSLALDRIGVMVTTQLVKLCQRELICDIDRELLSRAEQSQESVGA